jgi:aspartyl-tRNA(Asn)/glutamyl-tRNA(Gln) amidotransferase subunit A
MDVCERTLTELAILLRRREISALELTLSVLERIRACEDVYNAFITVSERTAIRQAKAADRALKKGRDLSPLLGIPVAIKDNICTKGLKTTCASRMLEGYIPPYDATVVRSLKKAMSVIVGKTNLDEFAMGSSTENSAFGPTKNPRDTEYVPGGSSGGSAAAVAAGEAVIGIGTDTGGSVRLPAAFCSLVGMKPTYGRISRYGVIAYASSLDQVGCITRSVEDCAAVMECICGHDPLDGTSVKMQPLRVRDGVHKGIKGLRIGIPREYFVEGLDPRVGEIVMKAAGVLESEGAELKRVSLPHTGYAVACYYLLATAEASSNLARYDGVKYGARDDHEGPDIVSMYRAARSKGFGKEVKRRILLGTYVLSKGYYEAYYTKAQKVRTLIMQDFKNAFDEVDFLITPASPTLPFRLGERIEDPLAMYLADVHTVAVNLAGLPGLVIPCGSLEGLSVGAQLIGRPFDEETILKAGYVLERNREAYRGWIGR